jgi:3-methyladenine DNA glycosylase AlkD
MGVVSLLFYWAGLLSLEYRPALMSKELLEIETALAAYPCRTSTQIPESYIGGGQSGLRFLGLKVLHLRQALKTGFSFSGKDFAEVAEIWDRIWWESDCFEVLALALAWFEDRRRTSFLPSQWGQLRKWSGKIDNWAHSDALSNLYARILEQDSTLVYPTLEEWSASENPWLRRLSIVSLLYYSGQRQTCLPFRKIIALVEPQLSHDHHYVQRGVGWVLREAGNVYPLETNAFLGKNAAQLSAIAFAAATEKLSFCKKEKLKQKRKLGGAARRSQRGKS